MSEGFEGSEKCLEVVLREGHGSFRARGPAFAETIVERADASILRTTQTTYVDAYLLAESTLFVSDTHLLLLTCGRTRLVRAALYVLEQFGEAALASLTFTRLGERFPEAQPSRLGEDVSELASQLSGTYHPLLQAPPHAGGLYAYEASARARVPGEVRFRIVANDFDEALAHAFEGAARPAPRTVLPELFEALGPDAVVEGYDFSPSGYSLNAVDGLATFALHVTPEASSRYVSFVSSADDDARNEALGALVLGRFAPATCLVTSEMPFEPGPRYVVTERDVVSFGARTLFLCAARRAD